MSRVLGSAVLLLSALPVWAQDAPGLRRVAVETGEPQTLPESASVRTEREDPDTGRFERVRASGTRLSGHPLPGFVGDGLVGESDGTPFDARVTGEVGGLPHPIYAPVEFPERVFFLSGTEPGSADSRPQIWVTDHTEAGTRLLYEEDRESSFGDQFGLLARWDDVALYALPVGIVSENASRAVFVHADGRVAPTWMAGTLQYLTVGRRHFITGYRGGYGGPAGTFLGEVFPDSLSIALPRLRRHRDVAASWFGFRGEMRERDGRLVVSYQTDEVHDRRRRLGKVVWEFDVRHDPAPVRVLRDDRRSPPPTFESIFEERVGNPSRTERERRRTRRPRRVQRKSRHPAPSRETPLWDSLTERRAPAVLGTTDRALIVRVPDGRHRSVAGIVRPGASRVETDDLGEVTTLPRVRIGDALPTTLLLGDRDRVRLPSETGLRRLDAATGALEVLEGRTPTAIVSAEGYAAVLIDGVIELLLDGTSELVPLRDVADHAPEEVAELVAVGREVYFLDHSGDQTRLWVTDGTAAGTRAVSALAEGEGSGTANRFAVLGDRLVFTARDPEHGRELWSAADGVARLEADLLPGPASSEPREVTTVGDQVWFSAETTDGGREPYRWSAGAPPVLVGDLASGEESSHPAEFVRAGGGVWFAATTPTHGRELWFVPDGEAPRRVTDLARGRGSAWPRDLRPLPDGHTIAFTARSGGRRRAVYLADARDGGVRRLPGTAGRRGLRDPARLHVLSSELYFDALDRRGDPALFACRLDAAGLDVSGIDTDRDGFPDEVEFGAGSDASDAADTPTDLQAVRDDGTLVVRRLRLRAAPRGRRRVAGRVVVDLPLTDVSGRTLLLDVDGVIRTGVVSADGTRVDGDHLRGTARVVDGSTRLVLRIRPAARGESDRLRDAHDRPLRIRLQLGDRAFSRP